MVDKWLPNTWRAKKAKHIPIYENKEDLEEVLSSIKKFPPLVFAGEARLLQNKLADVVYLGERKKNLPIICINFF